MIIKPLRHIPGIGRVALLLTLSLLFVQSRLSGQSIRASYKKKKKNDPAQNFRAPLDMRLDFYQGLATFYSENTYLRDSLTAIAFDPLTGEVVDDDAYTQLTRIPAAIKDLTLVNYHEGHFSQSYHEATFFFNGMGSLSLLQWTITDEVATASGFPAHKAEGDYLGRHWTIWYTEDIPVNSGPWLLWGAPGLIVYAMDSEELICFKLSGVEILEDNHRSEFLKEEYGGPKLRQTVYKYEIKESETIHTKFMTDMDYFNQMTGSRMEKIVDRNGRDITSSFKMNYIPLIPSSYWKD